MGEALLSPDDFVKRASERGVRLRVEELHELHRVRALVPMFRLLQRPSDREPIVPVAEVAEGMYHQVGSPLAHVLEAAGLRQLADPGLRPYRSWESGLKIQAFGHMHTYPLVSYSPYQLLGLRTYEGLARSMEAERVGEYGVRFRLPPPALESVEHEILDGCRRLAMFLHSIDMHYLSQITLTISYPDEWERSDPQFDLNARLAHFGLIPDDLQASADALLSQAHFLDPLGDWYELVRQAHPSTWNELKGDARLAMDYRIAAEILLKALDDLGRTDLSEPPPRQGRRGWAVLDDRLRRVPGRNEAALTARGLNPSPAVVLVLEGETEMLLMPTVLEALYGGPVPDSLVEIVGMRGIDRRLDLFVQREIAPRLGESHGNFVFLLRPPTRMLLAVDPEGKYKTEPQRELQRTKLVDRIYQGLPPQYQSPTSRKEVDLLVEIASWGKYPWEFANFTDAQLADGILSCTTPPQDTTRGALVSALHAERLVTNRSPNVLRITSEWNQRVGKTQLARALEPRLVTKVQADIARKQKGNEIQTPATKVAFRALELALSTHRRNVVLPIK